MLRQKSTGVGHVPEGRGVFPRLTVRENLEIGAFPIHSRSEVQQRMEAVFELFPRLNERLTQKGGRLSGGEQQMLATARGLILKIMFTYGMDASSMTGDKCNENFFRPGGSTDGRSFAIAQMLVLKGFQKFGIIAQDYSFGKEAVKAFKKKLMQLNPSAKIVAEIYHPLGTKAYASYARQLIAAAPDVIFTPNWGNDLTFLLKQGRPMGMKAKVASYYINDEVMIESLGDDNLTLGDMGA
jgi:hypothetical protein